MTKDRAYDSTAAARHRISVVVPTHVDHVADHAYEQHRPPPDEAQQKRHRFRSKCV